jgi:hypothetical protein
MLHPPRRQLEAIVRDAAGRQITRCLIQRGRYIIGSERGSEIVIRDPTISGIHARLTVVSDDEIYVEDNASANGTFVDSQLTAGPTRVALEAHVQLGACTLEFQLGGLPAAVFRQLPEGFFREQRYNFGEMVVQGRTSAIFEASDATLGRDVAIKVIRPESQGNIEHVLRFIREAQITSQLQHPGILSVYELGLNEQSQLYYTTRFVEGDSVGAVIDGLGVGDERLCARHSMATLLTVFQKACDTLAYAHSRGVVHGGLRPETITVGAYGEVIVINWCFARLVAHDARGKVCKHPVRAAAVDSIPPLSPYLAPEVAAGEWERVGPRSDVYALGAILYKLLTLRAPIDADDDAGLLRGILSGEIGAPAREAAHCPGGEVPEFLSAIAMKALSAGPEDRFGSVPELQQAILAWQNGGGRDGD